MRCEGGRENKDKVATADECAMQCLHITTMFIFSSKAACANNCPCKCETHASVDGTCNQERASGYNLYRFINQGNTNIYDDKTH